MIYRSKDEEEILKDFNELVKTIKQESKEHPEDDFLKDINDCLRKSGF